MLLAAKGKCGRVVGSGTWTITTFKEADRNSQPDVVGVAASSSQSNTGRDVTAALNDTIPLGVPACWSWHTADPTVSQHCHVTF